MEEPEASTPPAAAPSPPEPAAEPPRFENLYPNAKKPKKRHVGLVILIILVLAAAAAGAGFLLRKQPTKKPTNANQAANLNQTEATTSATKTYENGFLGITLTYPANWTVAETADNGVRLESPSFSYASLDHGHVTGNFRLYFRKGARDIDDKYIGRDYALEPSQKLVYSKPAVGQRTDTNLTLFGLDTPDNFAFMLIAGNFSLNKGDTLGPHYGTEAETYIIGGGFSSPDLKDDLATHPVSPAKAKSNPAYQQAINILKSLQLQ